MTYYLNRAKKNPNCRERYFIRVGSRRSPYRSLITYYFDSNLHPHSSLTSVLTQLMTITTTSTFVFVENEQEGQTNKTKSSRLYFFPSILITSRRTIFFWAAVHTHTYEHSENLNKSVNFFPCTKINSKNSGVIWSWWWLIRDVSFSRNAYLNQAPSSQHFFIIIKS